MAWRKWLVRSLVFLVTTTLAAGAWAYQHWTNPAAVRQKVLEKYEQYLPGARVSVESAHLLLLGGISVNEMRLARRDDAGAEDFAHFPSGTIYHDKEALLNGKLIIKKVVWNRPVLRVVRRQDGTWNLDGSILATPDLRVPVPMLVLQQGTIFIEDQRNCPSAPPIEIKNVSLTISNDERPTLQFKGDGTAGLFGPVQIKASLGRASHELQVSLQFSRVPVGGELMERLAAYCPGVGAHARQLTGNGQLRADLSYDPTAHRPLSYDVRVQLKEGTLRHAQIPLPLEQLEAKARCVDGQFTIESISARSGATTCRLTHVTFPPEADGDVDGRLEVQHLALTEPLFAALPAKLAIIREEYKPTGVTSLELDFHRRMGQWRFHSVVQPEDIAASYVKFPYVLEHVRGRIEQELDPLKSINRVQIDVVGFAGNQPIYLQGRVDVNRSAIGVRVWGKSIPINGKLIAALQPEYQKLAESFTPSGLADVDLLIRRDPGDERCHNHILAAFHDCALRYEIFPYPLESASGTLDIQRDQWEVRDFRATHKGGEFRGHGRSDPQDHTRLNIDIVGNNVLLDPEMEGSLKMHGLKTAWKKLSPSGRISFEAHVDQAKGQSPDIAVTVWPHRCSMRAEFFPYELTDVTGQIQFDHQVVHVQDMKARHGATMLSLRDGKIHLRPDGSVSLDLFEVGGNPIVPDGELLRALPRPLDETCAGLQLRQPLSLLARMIIDVPADGSPPYIFWDGGLRLKNATLHAGVDMTQVTGEVLCRGEYRGAFGRVLGNVALDQATILQQRFQNIQGQILVSEHDPNVFDLKDVKCRLYGGTVDGGVHLVSGPVPRFEIKLNGFRIQLEEFASLNGLGKDAQMSGLATARFYLRGQGNNPDSMEGAGVIDVPDGKMSNLPPLLDLLKVLNLRPPDRTAFEEAHIRFSIRGQRVDFDQLDLFGNSISLGGKGTMKIDGSDLNLDFYAFWGRIMQWSPPVLDKMWPALSKSLLKIKLRGSISQRTVTKELVPPIMEPVKKFFSR